MNKYKITTFVAGQANTFIVAAFDIYSALQSSSFNSIDVVSAELIGTTEFVYVE